MPLESRGFTLIEVLIAMAITAFIALASYNGLSAVISGVESTRSQAEELHEVSRAVNILSRDIRQLVNRSVYDEFGQRASALEGGPLAREMLSFTRAGWHNTVNTPRSTLQRVSYYMDGEQLIRAAWPVLDRAGAVEPREVVLLDGVESFEVRFLATVSALEVNRNAEVDRRLWQDNWLADVSQPGTVLAPPVALEVRFELTGWGVLERLYVLPPL